MSLGGWEASRCDSLRSSTWFVWRWYCAARHGGAQQVCMAVRGVCWSGSICLCKLCLCTQFDRWNLNKTPRSSDFSKLSLLNFTWWYELRPGSSTDSAMDHCARRRGARKQLRVMTAVCARRCLGLWPGPEREVRPGHGKVRRVRFCRKPRRHLHRTHPPAPVISWR